MANYLWLGGGLLILPVYVYFVAKAAAIGVCRGIKIIKKEER